MKLENDSNSSMKGEILIPASISTIAIPILVLALASIQYTYGQSQTPQQPQANQTGNSSIPIAPGALLYPGYKPCKDNPGVLCSIPPKPPKPIPPNNTTILPP